MLQSQAIQRDLDGVAGELHSRIDGHEDLCAERMRRIDERLQAGDAARERMRCEMREGFAALKQSLRDIHARLWWAAASVIGVQACVIGWFLATNGLPGLER